MWAVLLLLFVVLVAGLLIGWTALFWLIAAIAVAATLYAVISGAGRRKMQQTINTTPGIIFDESWCNQKGTYAIATSSFQGKIGIFTRQGHTIHHHLFDETSLRRVEMLESGVLAQRRGEMTRILRLTLAGEAEPVMVPFWDDVASEDNSEWQQVAIAAADWTQHLIEIMARVAQSVDKPLPDVDTTHPAPPATPRPSRAKTPRKPRAPTVQPAR